MNTKEKPKKRGKRTSRQVVEKNLDNLVAEIVKARDEFCVCPAPQNGHSSVKQCGHLFTRSKKSLRWSLMNCHVQCSGCNLLHEYNPHRYTVWFINQFGLCKYLELARESEQLSLLKVYELNELLEQLKLIREKQTQEPLWKPYFSQQEILSGAWRNL